MKLAPVHALEGCIAIYLTLGVAVIAHGAYREGWFKPGERWDVPRVVAVVLAVLAWPLFFGANYDD